jgi:aminoglycoside phosphotransferase (APT) family kinase protein
MSGDSETVAVREAVSAVFGPEAGIARAPWKLAGGTMHDMWGVDVLRDNARLELVVRTSPRVHDDLIVARREFASMSESRRRGVMAPAVHGVGATSAGEPYLVIGRIQGDTSPRPLLRDPGLAEARHRIVSQLTESLVKIHSIHPADLDMPLDSPEPGEEPLLAQLRGVTQKYDEDRLERHPVIEWALRWVRRQAAAFPTRALDPVLVHGDFRVGNIMYDQDGLTAVLDWEGAHAGDPLEDLAWFCVRVWRFGQNSLEAGGLVHREDWIRAYETASGCHVDRARFELWEILCNIRWAVITLNQVKAHLDGTFRSQELAAIGRRTGETEIEILRLAQNYKDVN